MKNPTNRPQIIPSNWICEDCPHSFRSNPWEYRCACCAPFEDGDNYVIAIFEDDETPICARAASEGFIARKCADDNKLHLRGDYGYADDGDYYSGDHCRANFYHCEGCGLWVTDYYDFDSELQMCTTCADEYRREQNRIIGNWHEHKGCFEKVGDYFDPYTVGVEIEVEGYDCDHEETAHLIDDTFDGAFVFEYDCSLYDGFEIISQPHTLDAFRALDLERLERLLMREGYEETDSADTTGLHVHYSTAFLGDTEEERTRTLARLIRFYDSNFDLLCELTDRKDTGHSAPNECENYCYDFNDDYELTRVNIEGSRYVAVNCTNYRRGNGTIEVRLCDGTIRADKIRAWVDFNAALMTCLQERNTTSIYEVVPYMSDRTVDFFGM